MHILLANMLLLRQVPSGGCSSPEVADVQISFHTTGTQGKQSAEETPTLWPCFPHQRACALLQRVPWARVTPGLPEGRERELSVLN